jgi:hypothetical protein
MVMLCYDWVCRDYKCESTKDHATAIKKRSLVTDQGEYFLDPLYIVNLAHPLGIVSENW